jgi:hypothetical protein
MIDDKNILELRDRFALVFQAQPIIMFGSHAE